LPSGRFVGPVEVEVPRQADHRGRDFEIRAELVATCSPLLHISYPDGEVSRIGDGDERWQSLLALRAENNEPSAESPDEPPPPDTGSVTAPAGPGHLERVTIESWPGQLEFLRTREYRCSDRSRYERRYETGYDETGRISVWAEVPQEIGEAQLTVRVYEIIDGDAEAKTRERVSVQERERASAERRSIEVLDKVAAAHARGRRALGVASVARPARGGSRRYPAPARRRSLRAVAPGARLAVCRCTGGLPARVHTDFERHGAIRRRSLRITERKHLAGSKRRLAFASTTDSGAARSSSARARAS
jgi:hypothetical protein